MNAVCMTYAEYLHRHPIPFSGTMLPKIGGKNRRLKVNPAVIEKPKVEAKRTAAVEKATTAVRPMDATAAHQSQRHKDYCDKLVAMYSVMAGRGWMSPKQIAALTGVTSSAKFKHLEQLVALRYVIAQHRNRHPVEGKNTHRIYRWREKACVPIE